MSKAGETLKALYSGFENAVLFGEWKKKRVAEEGAQRNPQRSFGRVIDGRYGLDYQKKVEKDVLKFQERALAAQSAGNHDEARKIDAERRKLQNLVQRASKKKSPFISDSLEKGEIIDFSYIQQNAGQAPQKRKGDEGGQ